MQNREQSVGPWEIIADGSWMHGKRYSLREGSTIIGRSTEADITLPSNHLSRQHAELKCKGGVMTVTDLGSANGTFLNEHRIQKSELQAGDRIRFDTFSFIVQGPTARKGLTARKTTVHPGGAKLAAGRKSTSPGNRIEAPEKPSAIWLKGISTVIVLVCLGYIGYLLLQL
ncbi:FHA domain-containing protein [Halioxenophilus sp. WMMB6]|uniref:FHA domain-containing protein n=1 Tax=Halioxenophilus sp. WMMB6 TaxID=3073815 RepID=UPI00295EE969|nr:FHA domain-containing protein [Halioxenophilus sp. WMMB6]